MTEDMNRFMVGLDLSDIDQKVIEYTKFIADILKPEKIYFIHAEEDLDLPEEVKKEVYSGDQPFDEYLKEEIDKKVKPVFEHGIHEYEIKIAEGQPTESLMHWSHVKDIDLMIFGRKKELSGSGILPKALARKCPSPFLFVAEDASLQIEKIAIATDFSEHSELVYRKAQEISDSQGSDITAYHTYNVPIGYYKTGKSYDEFASIMKGHAEKHFNEFTKKLKIETSDLDCRYLLFEDGWHADELIDAMLEDGCDFIIMGSKGRTNASALLLGSMAERMVETDTRIPLMVIKKKNENMGFFKALLNL